MTGRATGNHAPQRLEMGQLQEAVDWATTTEWQGEPNPRQLNLEVDALVETELATGAAPPIAAATEPSGTPPAPPLGSPPNQRVIVRGYKNGGFAVEYHAISGHVHVIGRHKNEAWAWSRARAYARIQNCPVQAAP